MCLQKRVCLPLKGVGCCQPLAPLKVNGNVPTPHPCTLSSFLQMLAAFAQRPSSNSVSVLHRHRGHGASWHRPEEGEVLPQRRIPVHLPLHTWIRLAGCQTSPPARERGAQSQWEVGGTTGCPAGGQPPRTVLHELASAPLPSGHCLICATGAYWEVEKRKETSRVSVCV